MKTRTLARWALREALVLIVIGAIPALIAGGGVIFALKKTCGAMWNSTCQARIAHHHAINEPVKMTQVHIKPEFIRPMMLGTYRGP